MKSSLLCLVASLLTGGVEAIITTEILASNGLNFTCTILKHTSPDPSAPIKEVMLLHGFPLYRVWWHPLLFYWDSILNDEEDGRTLPPVSVHAVACDLRGYSPGASPDSIEEYGYGNFGRDVYGLANASGFDHRSFHLIGHDHGAGLAWEIAAFEQPNLLSLTTMAVPHNALMSNALCGDNTDEEQVFASNYFNQFSLPDSATRNNASLTKMFEIHMGMELVPETFQKLLWWYNGTMAKYWSMPRVVSDAEVIAMASTDLAATAATITATRNAIPMEERPCITSSLFAGPVVIPTLFICGVHDVSILCNNSFATDYPPELLPNYEHANFQCEHTFFNKGDCSSMDESRAVMDKITAHVLGNKTGAKDTSGQTDGTEGIPEETEDTPASSASILGITRNTPLLLLSGSALMALPSLMW